MRQRPGLLLVGHGSRSPQGQAELLMLGRSLAEARPDLVVETGFLELSEPTAGEALEFMISRGADDITVVPATLTSAGHTKSDLPAVVWDGRLNHPDIEIRYARPLGIHRSILKLAGRRLSEASATKLPLAVIGRGTSDPDANAEVAAAARLLAEWSDTQRLQIGFSSLTWPSTTEALEALAALGASKIGLFSWFVCTGVLIDRIRSEAAEFSERSGIPIVDAGYLGPTPELVEAIVDRYEEAVGGTAAANCDTCSYRMPFPGLESRVGQPVGIGHSLLAAEHRHSHDPAHDHHSSEMLS